MWHPWWALVHRRSLRTGETCARLKALSLIEMDRVSTSSVKPPVPTSYLSISRILLCGSRTEKRSDRRGWN